MTSPSSPSGLATRLGPLDPLDRILVASVLESTIDQLAIVGGTLPHTSSSGSIFPHPNVSAATLDSILLQENKALLHSRAAYSGRELHLLALRRLSSETSYVRRVLEDTAEELREAATGATLAESVAKSQQRKREREHIT